MIVLSGLSKQQKALAQTLWDLETMEEVHDYMNGLPKRMRGQAKTVFELMVAASMDQVMETDLAEKVINSVK
jgi:hypothetical protein